MSGELELLATTAATTLVGLMATDGWAQARPVFRSLWARLRPDRADRVAEDLDDARATVEAARRRQDADAEAAVLTEWQGRLRGLLAAGAPAVAEVDRMVRELAPLLRATTPSTAVTMHADARGHGRVYQAAGNMEINE
jgi:hypothetical protein